MIANRLRLSTLKKKTYTLAVLRIRKKSTERLVVRNQKEREALCEAVEIAANRGGRIWNEMVEDHGKIIGEAMENITRKGKKAVDMWRSTDRKIITYLDDKENMSNYVIDRLTSLKRQENDIEPFIVKSITDKDRKTEREEYYKRKSKLENIRWEQKEAAEWNKYYRRMVKEDREYVLDVQPLEDRTRRKITMMDSGQDEIIKKLLEYQQRKTQKQIKRHENRKKWLTLLSRKMKHRENSVTQMKMKSESNIGKEKQEKWKWWKTTRFRKCKNKETKSSLQNELTNMKTDDSQNSQTSEISDNSKK
ncbi:hypothetical protein O3M35_005998 [Rhynocoris fuscipes]|uniref:Uncharacterized protein n=1 Tax=Rhynocoris fuscipes TaxID=488301 RepID=A0AAW1DH05_9HEMI